MKLFSSHFLDRPELDKFTRELKQGEYLFRAGDRGQTMFIVLQGSVAIYDAWHGGDVLIGIVGWGQVLGEQAIVGDSDYERQFSAKALTRARLLEFNVEDMRIIEKRIPDFTLRVLQITSRWLHRTNRLVEVLHPTDETERLVRAIIFLNQEKKASQSEEITLEQLLHITGLDAVKIESFLKFLARESIVFPTNTGYTLSEESTLAARIRTVADKYVPSPSKPVKRAA